ncbi:tetratricopeptide repeat protein [Thiofilum flexile]|uniref:tetratricopeptide repeat protein n=1 Tax=Thiofilum flexile TaxID=125627 RepID=UPI0003787424|nr:tetratricopeptide repeat protein [Thiofilum flexile]
MKTIQSLRLATTIAMCLGLSWGLTQTVQANPRIQEQAPPWLQPAPAPTASAAINAVIKAAQGGHPRAQYDLAVMYQKGQGIGKDLNQAAYWLNKAAQGGEPEAQYLLSQVYHQGTLGRADVKRALYWGTEAAKRGHVEAQYWLGVTYVNGDGVVADESQGRYWLKQAVQRGSQAAKVALQSVSPAASQVAYQRPPTSAPSQVYKRPPSTSSPVELALNTVAPVPTEPPDYPSAAAPMPARLPEPNITEAFNEPRYPRVNADMQRRIQNQAEASGGARISLNGMNPNDILELANSGDQYAQFLIGALYEEGSGGFTQSYREAARWYRRAARQNYPRAQYNLALMYEDGRGVEQDYKQAGQWYAQAAKGGFTKAKNNLGILYVMGKGVRKNTKTAEYLFKQAAQEGDKDAEYNLARLVKG